MFMQGTIYHLTFHMPSKGQPCNQLFLYKSFVDSCVTTHTIKKSCIAHTENVLYPLIVYLYKFTGLIFTPIIYLF